MTARARPRWSTGIEPRRTAALLALAAALACGSPSGAPPAREKSPLHDHSPHHGGAVSMAGDLHVEAVATPDGSVHVYLSDLRRSPLPLAGTTGAVTLALPDGKQTLPLAPREQALEARGPPLAVGDVRARVSLLRDGRPIELYLVVPVGIPPGLAGLPRSCAPPLGPAPRDALLPRCTVHFHRMVRAVAATPDGSSLLVAVVGHGVSIWRLPSGEAIGAFDPMPGGDAQVEHVHPIDALAVRPDGREAAAAIQGSILRYGLPAGQLVRELPRDYHAIRALAYSDDGTRLSLSTFTDGSVELVRADDGRELDRLRIDRPLTAVALGSGAGPSVLASETGPLSLFAAGSRVPGRVLDASTPARAVAVAGDGVLAATDDGAIAMWNAASGRALFRTAGGASVITLAVRPDGGLVASGCHDGTVKLHALPDGRLVRTLTWHTSPVQALAWAGRFLVSGDTAGRLALWDVQ